MENSMNMPMSPIGSTLDLAMRIQNSVNHLSLPTGKDKYEITVKDVKGLRITINKSGKIAYLYRYTFNRTKCAIKIGNHPEMTAIAVAEQCCRFNQFIQIGIDPRIEMGKIKTMPTLKAYFIDVYLPYAEANKKSWSDDQCRFKLHLAPSLGDILLDKISSAMVNQALQMSKDKGLSNASINRIRALISSILTKAYTNELIEHNPMIRVPKYKEKNHVDRYLNEAESQRLNAVLDHPQQYEINNTVIISILKLLMVTGMRKSEVLNLRWNDVDFQHATLKLDENKSGKARIIQLNLTALAIIQGMSRQFRYVFANPETGLPYQDIRKTFKAVLAKANIQNFRIHDLRHNFASAAVNSGQDIYVVQHLLGHASPLTTQRYAHLRQDTLRAASESISQVIRQPHC